MTFFKYEQVIFWTFGILYIVTSCAKHDIENVNKSLLKYFSWRFHEIV